MRSSEERFERAYRIFDITVRSNFPLCGIPEAGSSSGLVLNVEKNGPVEDAGFNRVHEWRSATGAISIACARLGNDYLLRFPGLADFHLQIANAGIRAFAEPGCSMATLAHLLVDQVIPRMLCHLGRMVMHASAVVLTGNRTVAFLGDTGRGKSTLAASFFRAGAGLVTDDCLLLEKCGSKLTGIPAYPSLRLWPDSVEALFPDPGKFTAMAHYTNKQQVMLADVAEPDGGEVPLNALFVLGDPCAAPKDEKVLFERVSGSAAIMAMIEAAFVLDVESRASVRRNFETVGEMARSGTPVYLLNYERHYARLPFVRREVEKVTK